MPLLPFKTKTDGPASSNMLPKDKPDIIDEAFQLFRVNVLFKDFPIEGPADKVLVYLIVLIGFMLKST